MNPPAALILGSGTSNGVPTLGKAYPPAFLANPKNHRTRSSCLLQGPGGNVLIDAGPDMRTQLLREGILDLEAVIITHTHADHIMGLDDIRAFCLKYGKAIPVYATPESQADIERIFPYAFSPAIPGVWVPRLEFRDVTAEIEIAGLTLQTFFVEHGTLPCLAFRVNDFAYLTDVSRIPESVMPLLRGLDTLVIDAVRYKPHPNHMHFARSLEVAEELGARQTFFTHLSDDYDHDVSEATLPPGVRLAFDGLHIPL